MVANEADRLARIVNDILWASRVESGTLSVTIESCDPARLAREVVEAQRAHLPPGIRLSVSMPGGLPQVAADPDKIRQVLVNLLDNAVKYSPDGGEVKLALASSNSRLRFAVRDEGLGIPPSEHSHVFEKFYRLDPDLNRGVGALGSASTSRASSCAGWAGGSSCGRTPARGRPSPSTYRSPSGSRRTKRAPPGAGVS